MKYEGIETENFTEREFCALPRQGRKSLLRAKAAGAQFAPEKEMGHAPLWPGPAWKQAALAKYSLPSPKIRRDRDGSGVIGGAPVGPETHRRADLDACGNPVGTKYDTYGNVVGDGEEEI